MVAVTVVSSKARAWSGAGTPLAAGGQVGRDKTAGPAAAWTFVAAATAKGVPAQDRAVASPPQPTCCKVGGPALLATRHGRRWLARPRGVHRVVASQRSGRRRRRRRCPRPVPRHRVWPRRGSGELSMHCAFVFILGVVGVHGSRKLEEWLLGHHARRTSPSRLRLGCTDCRSSSGCDGCRCWAHIRVLWVRGVLQRRRHQQRLSGRCWSCY